MPLSLAPCLVCLLVQVAVGAVEGQGWQAFKNDATEIIPGLGEYPEPPQELENNQTMNRAENGGRPPHHPYDTKGMGCRNLSPMGVLGGGWGGFRIFFGGLCGWLASAISGEGQICLEEYLHRVRLWRTGLGGWQ